MNENLTIQKMAEFLRNQATMYHALLTAEQAKPVDDRDTGFLFGAGHAYDCAAFLLESAAKNA